MTVGCRGLKPDSMALTTCRNRTIPTRRMARSKSRWTLTTHFVPTNHQRCSIDCPRKLTGSTDWPTNPTRTNRMTGNASFGKERIPYYPRMAVWTTVGMNRYSSNLTTQTENCRMATNRCPTYWIETTGCSNHLIGTIDSPMNRTS